MFMVACLVSRTKNPCGVVLPRGHVLHAWPCKCFALLQTKARLVFMSKHKTNASFICFISFLFLGYAMIYVFANDLSIRMPRNLQSCALASPSEFDSIFSFFLLSLPAWHLPEPS